MVGVAFICYDRVTPYFEMPLADGNTSWCLASAIAFVDLCTLVLI